MVRFHAPQPTSLIDLPAYGVFDEHKQDNKTIFSSFQVFHELFSEMNKFYFERDEIDEGYT